MSDYAPVTSGGIRWLVGRDWVALFRDGPFAELEALLARSRVVKDLRAKKTWEVEVDGRAFLVKKYKAGSWLASLKRLIIGSRASRELDMCRGVIRRGVATVPLAAAAARGRESFVVVEKLPGWTSLDEILRRGGLAGKRRTDVLKSYGAWARQVHAAGVWQSDFNPSNVLASPGVDEFRLIDFEKMKLRSAVSETARLKLLAKLTPLDYLPPPDFDAILEGYLKDGERLEEIAGRIRRFSRDYAEGRSRVLARDCVRENRHFAPFKAGRYSGHRRKPHRELKSPGLEMDDVERIAAGDELASYRRVQSTTALRDWKDANAAVVAGQPVPLAAFVEKGGRRGFLVYRREG